MYTSDIEGQGLLASYIIIGYYYKQLQELQPTWVTAGNKDIFLPEFQFVDVEQQGQDREQSYCQQCTLFADIKTFS